MQTEHLIEQLLNPATYPHSVTMITTIETHISIVFLTGEFAYKLKKPVNFGFLDFSALTARQRFCELEISLNKRTAPDLYLDVCPLYLDSTNQKISFEPKANAVEYLVKMRQFDPNKVLGTYLQHHTLEHSQVQFLANALAKFHLAAQSTTTDSNWGHPDDIIQPMLDNFATLLNNFTHDETQYRLKHLSDWTKFTQKSLWQILLQRKQEGFIKACHGDMHLDNITLIDGQPTLFDGIEFNEQFRWIDTQNDLAFLLIDLDYRGKQRLKRQILNRYVQETGDFDGLKLLMFYQVYRAMVRSKITALRFHQFDKNSPERPIYWQRALDYLKQAEDYAYRVSQPTLMLMQGVSGSGKSFYAQQILQDQDVIILSSDRERKRLFGIEPLTRVDDKDRLKLYSQEMNQRTHDRLQHLAKQLLRDGFSVIVDATFLKAEHRAPYQALAQCHQAAFVIFSIDPDQELVEKQIQQRITENQDPSDANVYVMQQQLKHNQRPISDFNIWHQASGASLPVPEFNYWLQSAQDNWQDFYETHQAIT